MRAVQPSGAAFYGRYLNRCNEHRFDELAEFVSEQVRVNDEPQGLAAYVDGLRTVVEAFPDYHWDLRHLFVDGDHLSAHLLDTGTHRGTFHGVPATGRRVATHELAVYRLDQGRIAEVWVAADDLALLSRLTGPSPRSRQDAGR